MKNIDSENASFWNEMCGSNLAKSLGISDDSSSSLKKYDDYYLNYYPYLLNEVPVHTFKGLKVMEVGLGYGTLSQKIAENCEMYRGIDIAAGPVNLVNKRLSRLNMDGNAQVGSIKDCPFEDNTFDVVVAIGCYHHTGDLSKAISETSRVLKPGGRCFLMVYNKYSYRQWKNSPILTFKRFLKEGFNSRAIEIDATTEERRAFDANSLGEAAPETRFYSVSELKQIMSRHFTAVVLKKRNMDNFRLFRATIVAREMFLKVVGPLCGLDIYFQGRKKC
jgi:SAM-dependent methyltransferase